MMAKNDEKSFLFEISPSVSDLIFHAAETGESYMEFSEAKSFDRFKVTFRRFISGKMLAIGGENTRGFDTLSNSAWLKELVEYQRKNYPSSADNFKNVKHFCFHGHDVRVEVLAEGFTWELLSKGR